jgi:hypothetical protein
MEESLREILQPLTRYSANDPELPVNDPTLFTGALSRATSLTRRCRANICICEWLLSLPKQAIRYCVCCACVAGARCQLFDQLS